MSELLPLPHEGEPLPEGHVQKDPTNIMTSATFITFLLAYIKDLKNDSGLVIQVSQRVMTLLESFKVGLDALHKLNED